MTDLQKFQFHYKRQKFLRAVWRDRASLLGLGFFILPLGYIMTFIQIPLSMLELLYPLSCQHSKLTTEGSITV